jgi:hypothetical protein
MLERQAMESVVAEEAIGYAERQIGVLARVRERI